MRGISWVLFHASSLKTEAIHHTVYKCLSACFLSFVVQSLSCVWLCNARYPCPSPSPRGCSNSCPLSQWYHPTILSSVFPSSHAFSLSQHQGLFKWVSSSHQVAKVLELQLQHQSFQRIFRTDFLEDGLVGSAYSPRDSQESSATPQFKSIA